MLSLLQVPVTGIVKSAVYIKEALSSVMAVREEDEEDKVLLKLALTGSTSYEFVNMFPNHHNQFEMTSYIQLRDEIILLMVMI